MSSLGSDIASIKKQTEAVAKNSEAEKQDRESKPEVTPVLAEIHAPQPITFKKYPEDRYKPCREWAVVLIQLLTLGAVVYYAVITTRIWRETKEATKATRDAAKAAQDAANTARESADIAKRHIEESDEAVIVARPDLPGHDSSVLHLQFVFNMLATDDLGQDEVKPSKDMSKSIALRIGKREWAAMENRTAAIVIKETARYENGFNSIRNPRFCHVYVSGHLSNSSSPPSYPAYVVECRSIADFLANPSTKQ